MINRNVNQELFTLVLRLYNFVSIHVIAYTYFQGVLIKKCISLGMEKKKVIQKTTALSLYFIYPSTVPNHLALICIYFK